MSSLYELCNLITIPILALGINACSVQQEEPSHFLFLGDTSFGESYFEDSRNNILSKYGYDYSLEHYKNFLLKMDEVVVNLETPITERRTSPHLGKDYIHWASTKGLESYLSHNIQHFALANNHSMDLGEEALIDTMNSLNHWGMSAFGAGANEEHAAEPLILESEESQVVAVISAFEYSSSYDEKYEFYAKDEKAGANPISIDLVEDQIQELEDEYENPFVIYFPHWGENYKEETAMQQKEAAELIEGGVDLILGHGSHMMQGIEEIEEKWVLYSLGNFVFNSPGRYEETEALPYSLMANLILAKDEIWLRAYPIFTNNLENNYQGYFVEEAQWLEVENEFPESWTRGQDEFGYYAETQVSGFEEE